MTAQRATHPAGRLATLARTAGARLRSGGRGGALALLLAVGLGAWAGAIAGVPASASGATAGAIAGAPASASDARGGESGGAPAESAPTSSCPASTPPNQITLVAGTPQTAIVGTAFATGLQVALSNSDGCPVTSAVAGTPVTFSAPSSGASGAFSTSASATAIVGADASGAAAAPPFTANTAAGSYTVTASSQYGSVSFALTNTAAGVPARIVAIRLKRRSASVMSRYPQPLRVRVLDADGNPVVGTTVTFTLGAGVASTCGTSTAASAGATFAGGGTQATASTGVSGVASSPLLTANSTAGSFTATAAVAGREPSGGSGKENGGGAAKPDGTSSTSTATAVRFSLANLAGKPVKLTPGVGVTQATLAGAPFPIPLAVTVTDAQKNPVPGALITFSAPLAGASGRFTVDTRGSHRRARVSHPLTARVKTGACGIAVAPAFTANHTQGGYIVKATVKHAWPAAFALVNQAPGQSS